MAPEFRPSKAANRLGFHSLRVDHDWAGNQFWIVEKQAAASDPIPPRIRKMARLAEHTAVKDLDRLIAKWRRHKSVADWLTFGPILEKADSQDRDGFFRQLNFWGTEIPFGVDAHFAHHVEQLLPDGCWAWVPGANPLLRLVDDKLRGLLMPIVRPGSPVVAPPSLPAKKAPAPLDRPRA